MIVLDASAAIDIVCHTEEGVALQGLILEKETTIAPHVFCAEVSNGLRTLVHAAHLEGATALAKVNEAILLVDEFVDDKDLLPEALSEALLYNHATYDMFYLVLARRRGATLFTRDKKLMEMCDAVGVDCIHLVDFPLSDTTRCKNGVL